jgi:hypothetical protein
MATELFPCEFLPALFPIAIVFIPPLIPALSPKNTLLLPIIHCVPSYTK